MLNGKKAFLDLSKGRSPYRSLHFASLRRESRNTFYFQNDPRVQRELKILCNNSNCACSSAVRFARTARTTDMEIGLKVVIFQNQPGTKFQLLSLKGPILKK